MNTFGATLIGVCAAGAVCAYAPPQPTLPAPAGLQSNLVFTQYSPLSSAAEIVRRTMSPLDARRVMLVAKRKGTSLQGQAVDLSKERFSLYVPRAAPPEGYSLLVFVSPFEDASVPTEWITALDRHATIFVTAAHSGNSENVFDRREPLALLGAVNVLSRYAVDPRRIYVGGFSGGSRVAERLAVGYPDLFRGVLLDAGSDPLGDPHLAPPPADLFARLQESSRVVYATGARDTYHMAEDSHSRQSMQAWCVFDVATESLPWTSHELPDASAFDRQLDALSVTNAPDPAKLAECRAGVNLSLDAALSEVQGFTQDGKMEKAQRALDKMDGHFGGLAAVRILALPADLIPAP